MGHRLRQGPPWRSLRAKRLSRSAGVRVVVNENGEHPGVTIQVVVRNFPTGKEPGQRHVTQRVAHDLEFVEESHRGLADADGHVVVEVAVDVVLLVALALEEFGELQRELLAGGAVGDLVRRGLAGFRLFLTSRSSITLPTLHQSRWQ